MHRSFINWSLSALSRWQTFRCEGIQYVYTHVYLHRARGNWRFNITYWLLRSMVAREYERASTGALSYQTSFIYEFHIIMCYVRVSNSISIWRVPYNTLCYVFFFFFFFLLFVCRYIMLITISYAGIAYNQNSKFVRLEIYSRRQRIIKAFLSRYLSENISTCWHLKQN